MLPFINTITTKDRAFLSRQLATMLSSGIPVTEALKVLISETRNPVILESLQTIQHDIESGLSFSSAIQRQPILFNEVYVAVARSGEASGRLEDVLSQMADNIEQESSLISKVRGAMIYPAFIFLAMISVAVLMMVRVIPQLKHIFTESGVQLPLSTRFLIGLSDFMVHQWWVVVLIVVAIVAAIRVYLPTQGGRQIIDYIEAHIPGQFSENLYMARFTRTMSMLIKAGIPIIEAIDITSQVMNNGIYQLILTQARAQVERGIPLSTPLAQTPYFPVIVSQMIRVGEQTGRLDEVLLKLALYYEDEVDSRIKTIATLIEPLIIVILGIAVAFLVIAILMPIYNIAQIQ